MTTQQDNSAQSVQQPTISISVPPDSFRFEPEPSFVPEVLCAGIEDTNWADKDLSKLRPRCLQEYPEEVIEAFIGNIRKWEEEAFYRISEHFGPHFKCLRCPREILRRLQNLGREFHPDFLYWFDNELLRASRTHDPELPNYVVRKRVYTPAYIGLVNSIDEGMADVDAHSWAMLLNEESGETEEKPWTRSSLRVWRQSCLIEETPAVIEQFVNSIKHWGRRKFVMLSFHRYSMRSAGMSSCLKCTAAVIKLLPPSSVSPALVREFGEKPAE